MQNPTKSQSVILVQRRYLLIMLQKCYNIYDPDIFICKSLHRPSLPTFTSFFGEVFLFWRGFWQIRISCKGKFLRPVVISPSLRWHLYDAVRQHHRRVDKKKVIQGDIQEAHLANRKESRLAEFSISTSLKLHLQLKAWRWGENSQLRPQIFSMQLY